MKVRACLLRGYQWLDSLVTWRRYYCMPGNTVWRFLRHACLPTRLSGRIALANVDMLVAEMAKQKIGNAARRRPLYHKVALEAIQ